MDKIRYIKALYLLSFLNKPYGLLLYKTIHLSAVMLYSLPILLQSHKISIKMTRSILGKSKSFYPYKFIEGLATYGASEFNVSHSYFPIFSFWMNFLKRVKYFNGLKNKKGKKRKLQKNFLNFFEKKQFDSRLKDFYIVKKKLNINLYSNFSLKQRNFISKKNILQTSWNFFFKQNKNSAEYTNAAVNSVHVEESKVKKLYFFNGYKYLAWKMRKARYAHWDYKTRGKLNEWRYNKLLSSEIHFLNNHKFSQMLIYLIFSTYGAMISWLQLMKLINYKIIIVNGLYLNSKLMQNLDNHALVELPYDIALSNCSRWNDGLINTIFKNKKFSYKLFSKTNKKKFNKKIPKTLKQTSAHQIFFGTSIAYDYTINAMYFIKRFPKFNYDIRANILTSSVISLQNWRFRFD